ncbi:DUF3105 domain-containing protein [Allobranchiibius sp. GilTou73]|uniref:DUF3105 domain-containing protein n=1 Tax=Allobranchiibius sp. GilTou73 TaxID=2904523 RepID=UPI001F26E4E5|nr:DUF3105 domain-containing protein [Allobranchiibius sp. GilTou73]UIJ35186.1 DUF3105 domain-containing protein [Allobranchiibius sp. GilTou73]
MTTHAQSTRRTRIAVVAGVVVVVLAIAAALGWWLTRDDGPTTTRQVLPSTPTGVRTIQDPVRLVRDTSGIPGVLAWDQAQYMTLATQDGKAVHLSHVRGPVTYTMTPPAGGPHNIVWMNAGVYTKPVPSERAVHNMEHGAIWITYDPKLPKSTVAKLVAFVGRQSLIPEPKGQGGVKVSGQANRFMDLSPWASNSLPSPIVLSSWGHQLRVTSATDPRMQRFVDTFRHRKPYSPETNEPVDGIPTGTGGVAARYGGVQPNPSGTKN